MKTRDKTHFDKPDSHIEKYCVLDIFENKFGRNKLIIQRKDGEICFYYMEKYIEKLGE